MIKRRIRILGGEERKIRKKNGKPCAYTATLAAGAIGSGGQSKGGGLLSSYRCQQWLGEGQDRSRRKQRRQIKTKTTGGHISASSPLNHLPRPPANKIRHPNYPVKGGERRLTQFSLVILPGRFSSQKSTLSKGKEQHPGQKSTSQDEMVQANSLRKNSRDELSTCAGDSDEVTPLLESQQADTKRSGYVTFPPSAEEEWKPSPGFWWIEV